MRLRVGEDNLCSTNNGAALVIGRTYNGSGGNLAVEQTSRSHQGENGENRDLEFVGFHNTHLEGVLFREQLTWNKLGKGGLN